MKIDNVESLVIKIICVVLIGQIGVGKSLIGNMLLGVNRFKNLFFLKFCIEVFQRELIVKRGFILEVVDILGLFDIYKLLEELRKEFLNCMMMINFGLYVFLLIFKMNCIIE